MAKQNKAVENTAPTKTKWYVSAFKRVSPWAIKVIDRVAQIVAAVFILGTSFLFVRDWLQTNQVNHDFSLVGGILVTSIALYLIVRKR